MPINRRNIEAMADYILSQGCEREECLKWIRDIENKPNRSVQRKIVHSHIWYIAYRAMYGAKEAMKATTKLLDEV